MYIKAFKSRQDKESYILRNELSHISPELDKYTLENEKKEKIQVPKIAVFNALDKLFKERE